MKPQKPILGSTREIAGSNPATEIKNQHEPCFQQGILRSKMVLVFLSFNDFSTIGLKIKIMLKIT